MAGWAPAAQTASSTVKATVPRDEANIEPTLENTADADLAGFAPRPDYRPLTKFEQRGIRLGHGVWDVIFRKEVAG